MTIYELKLYVVRRTPKSKVVVDKLVKILEEEIQGRYRLEIIDIIENPELAERAKILITPTLHKIAPEPASKIIGDLSDKKTILLALGLTA